MKGATILLADDDPAIRKVLTQFLENEGYRVRATSSGSTLWQWAQEGLGDLAVSDVVMPDADGLELLPKIRKIRPKLPVIMMSAKNTVLTALQASERGAFEYLPKPFDLRDLAQAIETALANDLTPAQDDRDALDLPIVGSSAKMQQVYRLIARVASTDLSVLIQGESGTGKELVAKVLHDFGPRRNKPFVALNMAAIPSDLIESELFGYEKGAFTGADSPRDGKFAQADGGTLFLDEIGDMPVSLQSRLLRVLQEGTFTRLGGRREQATDVRIIAATHRNLTEMIEQGSFRQDLFYRLNVVPIDLPPLRQRLSDLNELIPALVKNSTTNATIIKSFSNDAIEALKSHSWPGNVRELENFVERVSIIASGRLIDRNVVLEHLEKPKQVALANVGSTQSFDDACAVHFEAFFRQAQQPVADGQVYTHFLRRLERPLIEHALAATKGNQIRTSEVLGLNRNTLRKKIEDLDIQVVRGQGVLKSETDGSQ